MFSGQGSQYYQMGAEAYAQDRAYRAAMDECDRLAGPLAGRPLSRIALERPMADSERFDRLLETNLALLAQGYATARALEARGIRPDLYLGYSLGEFIAAAASGVLSLEATIELLREQARLVEQVAPEGAMIAILAGPRLLEEDATLARHCHLGCINGPEHIVVSASREAVPAITGALDRRGIVWFRLPLRYGFHSPFVDSVSEPLARLCFGLSTPSPARPVWSATLAAPIERLDARHVWTVLRAPVRFKDCIRRLNEVPGRVFVDCGPSGTLAGFARLCCGPEIRALPAMNQFGQNLLTLSQVEAALQ